MTKDEALTMALEALENGRSVRAGEGGTKYGLEAEAIAALRVAIAQPVQPVQEPVAWRDMVVVSLVREGVNKHKARELADHFATPPLPAAQAEPSDTNHLNCWQCRDAGYSTPICEPCNTGNRENCVYKKPPSRTTAQAEPVAWMFVHNTGGGHRHYTFHTHSGYQTAYRDTCLEEVRIPQSTAAHEITATPQPAIAAQAEPDKAEPVAWSILKAEQFCLAKKDGSRPFAKAWQPLYTTPPSPTKPAPLPDQPAAQAEPNEADQLLIGLRLDPDTYRTDGGWLNIPKIMAAIASPADYPYTKEQSK